MTAAILPSQQPQKCELIVTFNVGSATLKIGVYRHDNRPNPFIFAVNIDSKVKQCHWQGDVPDAIKDTAISDTKTTSVDFLQKLTPLYAQDKFIFVHRVVHGGERHQPCMITHEIFAELQDLAHLAPLHQPPALAIIDTINQLYHAHEFMQVGAFDTAFHAERPRLWAEYALPKNLREQGVRSYGFHGLSYQSIVRQMETYDKNLAGQRLIVAHLGSGCSITSILHGKTVDSSLGFSGLDGVPMGTRCGSLDAGVLLYLLEQGWEYPQILDCLYKQSGLLGLSEMSNDVRELHEIMHSQNANHAKENQEQEKATFALTYFCAHVAKIIAGLMTGLQGIDALIFTGGIGEHDAWVREKVVTYLNWLGIAIDNQKNQLGLMDKKITCISPKNQTIKIFVMATDEQYELYQAGLNLAN